MPSGRQQCPDQVNVAAGALLVTGFRFELAISDRRRMGVIQYNVTELPGPFRGALSVWIDLSWNDVEPKTEIPIEVIAELITPTGTATFSEMGSATFSSAESTGADRVSFVFPLTGTLHDSGLHVLNVSCNTGALLGQYLNVSIQPSA
jgi:hypothetical protein